MNWDELERNYQPIDLAATNARYTPQKKQKGFWQDQISTGGGIAGSLTGASIGAGIGSVVPGIGTAIGGLAGALIGGFGGGAAGQYVENGVMQEEDMSKDVLREGALNGIFGAGPLRLGGALVKGGSAALRGGGGTVVREAAEQGMTPIRNIINKKVGTSLEQGGTNLLGSQANLTRAQIRKLGAGGSPSEVLGGINKTTGLRSLDDMADVSNNVTGADGVLSELTRNAIGNSKGVDLGDLRQVADNLITNVAPLLSDSARKNVLSQVQNSVVKAYGGSKGSLSTLSNPLDSFDVARGFEKMAAKIRTSPTVSPADEQLATVYSTLARNINDRLYSAPGVKEGIALAREGASKQFATLAAQSTNKAQKEAYEKLAADVMKMKDIKSIRSAQAPYVKLGKIEQETLAAQNGAAAQFGGQLQGLGKLVQKPLNMLAMPLDAATPRVGGMMTNAGRSLQQGGMKLPGSPMNPLRMGGRLGAVGAVTNTGNIQPGAMPDMENQQDLESALLNGGTQFGDQGDLRQIPSNPFGVSQNQVAQQMMIALQNGDKQGFSQLQTMYELIGEYESQGAGGDLTSQQATLVSKNQTAASALDRLETLYNNAGGGGLLQGALAGVAGNMNMNASAKTYNDNIASAARFLGRAMGETGAGSDADAAAFIDKMPKLTDSPEVAQMKLAELRQLLADSRNNLMYYGGGGSSLEGALTEY